MTGTSRLRESVHDPGPIDALATELPLQQGVGFRMAVYAAATAALVLAILCARPAAPQTCSWGGTPSLPAPDAEPLRSIAGSLRAPGRIAVLSTTSILTTDPSAGNVVESDPHGTVLAVHSNLDSPYAIAVDDLGIVYVGELGGGLVTRYADGWQQAGSLGQGAGEFLIPTDIAIDPDPGLGHIYVTDGGAHQVRVYQPDGTFLRAFGGHGTAPGQFDFPAAVWVSAGGEVYVADQNNDRVQVFDRNGNFLRCFGNQEDGERKLGRIQGLTGDDLGRLYAADAFQGQVRVFDPGGVELAAIGGFGSLPGQLRTPAGIGIDSNNRLFVASVNNGRVEIFGIDDFADPPPGNGIFSDGFESGDSDAWSSTGP